MSIKWSDIEKYMRETEVVNEEEIEEKKEEIKPIIIKKDIKPIIANILNTVGFALLILLMVVLTYKDIIRLIK